MKLKLKSALAILGIMLSCFVANAQGKFAVKALFKDASNGEALSFVTVVISKPQAAKPTAYTLTEDNGSMTLTDIRPGTYVLKAEFLGYKAFEKEFTVKDADVDLGTLKLEPNSEQLEAAKVSAVGNPIQMKSDTIAFTASSVKTTDNDMLEDLLKKIPGMEVSEDGSVTHNGRSIDKITIDGKTFFLNDPQLATKNLPANIIEKVKVIEKKSDQAQFTGIDDGEDETIIDLVVKQGMMKGAFGNVMLGGGHDLPSTALQGDWRYQGAAFVGSFQEDKQLALIANSNNTNNRGFNDFAGSMMGAMGGGGMGRRQGGWGRGNGITTSTMVGINAGANLFDNKMEVSGNYALEDSRKYVTEDVDKTTFLTDSKLNNLSSGSNTTNSGGHRFGMRMEHKFSDNTSIIFEPQLNIGYGSYTEENNDSTSTCSSLADTWTPTNSSRNFTSGESKSLSTSGFALLRQKLGQPGRTMTLMGRFNVSNNSLQGLNNSNTTIYNEDGSTSESLVNQTFDGESNSYSLWGRATFTQPLGGNFYLEGNYSYSWSRSLSSKDSFDAGTGNRIDSYSNSIYNDFINQNIGVNALYQGTSYRFQLGFSAKPSRSTNRTNNASYSVDTTMTRFNWAPSAMAYFEIGENGSFRMNYLGNSQQPSTSQLITVADNSNPLAVSFGNPYLSQYFNHSIRGDFRYNNKKTYASFNARWNASFNDNPIVNGTWYTNGIAYTMPMNGPASKSAGMSMHINLPIKKSGFTIMNMTRINWSSSANYVGSDINTSDYILEDGSLNYTAFFNDYESIRSKFVENLTNTWSTMERLVVRYRSDALELELSARSRMNSSTYVIQDLSDKTLTFNNQLRGSIVWTVDNLGLTAKGDYSFNWYNGYSTPQPSENIFNLELQKLILKKKATLALKCYDVLGQSKNLTVSDSANYHSESVNNTLGRYIILSFTYRFGNFGAQRGGGMAPSGPMGPPPGRR